MKSTGVVTLKKAVDYESESSYEITVQAQSFDGSVSNKSFTIDVENDTKDDNWDFDLTVDTQNLVAGYKMQYGKNANIYDLVNSSDPNAATTNFNEGIGASHPKYPAGDVFPLYETYSNTGFQGTAGDWYTYFDENGDVAVGLSGTLRSLSFIGDTNISFSSDPMDYLTSTSRNGVNAQKAVDIFKSGNRDAFLEYLFFDANYVYDNSGDETIYTGGGSDVIWWSGGNDIIDGGEGFDRLNIYQKSENFDYLFGTNGELILLDNVNNYQITLKNIEKIHFYEWDWKGNNLNGTVSYDTGSGSYVIDDRPDSGRSFSNFVDNLSSNYGEIVNTEKLYVNKNSLSQIYEYKESKDISLDS